MDKIQDIVFVLEELSNDDTVPRNIKARVQEVITILNSNDELSIKKNKALHKLDELNEDTNLKAYTRSQIWNVLSLLEALD